MSDQQKSVARPTTLLAQMTEVLDSQLVKFLVDAIDRRERARVAILGGQSSVRLGRALRQMFDGVRVTRCDPAANESGLHVRLSSRTPYDVLIDLGELAGAQQVSLFERAFGHLVVGGTYLAQVAPTGTDDRTDETTDGASLDALRDHIARARATPFDRAAPQLSRDLACLGTQIQNLNDLGATLVVTKSRRVRPKLREGEMNVVLNSRPRLGEVLASKPGGKFASRCVYSDNSGPEGDTSGGFQDPYRYPVFDVPSLHFRRYERPVCARGQIVEARGLLLPETFRHHRYPRLTNIYVNDVAPLFGEVRQNLRGATELDGAYFHFDSEWPGHFGHTVTEQISRLWAISAARQLEPDIKLLTTLQRNRSPQRLAQWELELLSGFGFHENDVEIFDRPVRPSQLYTATPMFSCPSYVHPGIASVWSEIGLHLVAMSTRTDFPRRLFCSRRTNLKRACRNTPEVERFFTDHGFDVIYPEDHSLADQIAMFNRAEVIAGFAGSALFNIAFCETPRSVLMITPESYTARNEYLFSSVRGHRLSTIWTRPDTPHPPGRWTAEAFSSSFTFDFEREGAYLRRLVQELDDTDSTISPASGRKKG